jgi:hypothetical protein
MQFSRVAVFAALLSISASLFGQEFRGSFSGAVNDPSGAAIAGAKVTATETRTGTKTNTVTDASGKYVVPFLAPGLYQITVQAAGFKVSQRNDLTLGSDEKPVIDFRLEVGDAATSVVVSADAPLLDSENASVGQSITTKEVEEMPLNGRTPMMLAQLALGVIPTGTPTLVHPFDSGAPAAFSVGGTASQTSEILIDGSPDATWDGRQAYSPPHEAVQEVRVKAFDSDASFGHTAGGTMNQVLKTGTNNIHGALWEFTQPSNLTANSFFNNKAGLGNPVTHFNQYGFLFDGPVYLPKIYNGQNKLFWMFTYEALPDSQPNTNFVTVPTAAERQGNFSALLAAGSQYQLYDPNTAVQNGATITRSPFPGNIIPSNRLNPIALNYMKLYPDPNVTVGVGATGVNNFGNNATTNDDYNNQLGRIDYNMSERNRMFFDVRRTGYSQVKNNYFDNIAEGSILYRNNWGGTVDDVYMINPSTVLDSRVNFTRMYEAHALPSSGYDPTQLGFPSYLAGSSEYLQLPVVSLSTFQSLGATGANLLPSQSLQYFGDLTKIAGNHTLKFGADIRQYRLNTITYGNATGTFSFANSYVRASSSASSTVAQGQDLASLLLGLPTSGSYDLNTYASFYQYYFAGFVQDDWRVKSNLTVNLGLRFDHDDGYHEKWGRTTNGFDTTDANPLASAAIAAYNKSPISQILIGSFQVPGGLTFASPSHNGVFDNVSHRFSPRIGVAWSPTALKNTVIRAGFAMFVQPLSIASLSVSGAYSTNPIIAQEGFSQSTAFVASNNNFLTPANTLNNPFPTGFQQPAGAANGLATFEGQTISFLNPNEKDPYSLRWNFGIEHTLSPNTLLEVVYIGNHAVSLPVTVTQLNGIPRQYLSTLPVRDAAVNTAMSATVANPFAGLNTAQNGATTTAAQLLSRYPEFPVGYGSGVWSGSGGIIEQNLNVGSSYFDSLNVRLQKRLSKGLNVIANYIYSRLIEQDTWLNDSDPRPEKRVSPFDHPHRFVTAISYQLPFGKGAAVDLHHGWANALAGGWRLTSIYTWQFGAPITWINGSTTTPGDYVYYGGTGALQVSARNTNSAAFNTALFATNSANTFAYHIRTFSTTFPNIRQDGLNEWDPSLLKNVNVTERAYFQLRFEFFNVLNHPTFAAPNTTATNASFGLITAQANRQRTIQMGARFVF